MSIEIQDGSPNWYLSPDIWVVPGTNPEGPPGVPREGEPAFVWCRIHNNAGAPVKGVVVDFYWANPATVISRSSANPIGRSYATADPGSVEVLCVSAWVPSWVNEGHECLVVEISDSGPPSPSSVPFNPPAEPHVAQRNLTILSASQLKRFKMPFGAGEGKRKGTTVVVQRGKVAQLYRGKGGKVAGVPPGLEEAEKIEFGLASERGERHRAPLGSHELKLEGPRAPVLHVAADDISPGKGALLLVEERLGDRVVGGLGVLVVDSLPRHRDEAKREEAS